MEFTSRYNLEQNIKGSCCRKGDIFSRLPDDVISSHILSRLMPRDAGKCCLVSRRWRGLWKQSVCCRLIFNSLLGEGYRDSVQGVEKESQHFVSWVYNFLDLPQHNQPVDEFIVRFDLDSSYSYDINKWLIFAFRKGVQRLELDLSPYLHDTDKDYYVFPGIETLSPQLGLESNHGMIINTCYRTGLHSLRDLCFKHVAVDGEAIQYMLSKLHCLERLSVKSSNSLINLNVCGESTGLKHLEIVDCKKAEKIVISISSLVSLKYYGSNSALHMGYVPSLTEVCIGGGYCGSFLKRKADNLKCVSQLKKLKLNMKCKVVKKCVHFPLTFPKFLSLEQLEVKMKMYNGLFLLWPTILIKAAPALHTFSVKLKYHEQRLQSAFLKQLKYNYVKDDTVIVGCTPGLTREAQRIIKSASKQQQHECLKVVEIRQFIGNESDLMLARHLLRMPFVSLEKMVLSTSPHSLFKDFNRGSWYQKRSQERANLVKKWLPSSTELVIR